MPAASTCPGLLGEAGRETMIKWFAFAFALIALCTAADERKVREEFDRVWSRIDGQKCIMMVVLTPSGQATICAPQ
jgi:hypothetical protein